MRGEKGPFEKVALKRVKLGSKSSHSPRSGVCCSSQCLFGKDSGGISVRLKQLFTAAGEEKRKKKKKKNFAQTLSMAGKKVLPGTLVRTVGTKKSDKENEPPDICFESQSL